MSKQELLAKVQELINAYSCNPALKAAAESYLKAQDKASAEALIKSLEENVCSIDELIALCESDMGKQVFGAEKASEMAKLFRQKKSEGEKFCLCPACQAGAAIYAEKANLA